MNDADAEVQKARVMALYDRWVKTLGLAFWHWKFTWYRGNVPDSEGALFQICVRFEYRDVELEVCLPKVKDQSDDDLERAFCHEMGHVFTIPLKVAASKRVDGDAMHMLEEHQASAIGSALLWLRDSLVKAED